MSALTRVATPEKEDYRLMIADHGTASHVERLVRNDRRVKRNKALARGQRRISAGRHCGNSTGASTMTAAT